jgi:parvulin-like peptidyl-prolyl cis-trans isomerase-like protein
MRASRVALVKRFLKEPLAHFLLLGALIFAGHGLLGRDGARAPGRIVVSQGQLESMRVGFTRTWQRQPTREEWEGLIRDRVREEVYCREAMALGLDRDDTIIRRRLRQKMEFISDDIAARTPPTEADLGAYLAAHPESFRVEPRVTFRHVFLNPEKHGENLARDAARLLAQLRQAGARADAPALGDPFLLEHQFASVPASEVEKQFGKGFAATLGRIPAGEWRGPVESGYGVHLVWVSERAEGGLPALADVRDAVRREWDNGRRQEANEKFYQALLKSYTVTIEALEPGDAGRVAALEAK